MSETKQQRIGNLIDQIESHLGSLKKLLNPTGLLIVSDSIKHINELLKCVNLDIKVFTYDSTWSLEEFTSKLEETLSEIKPKQLKLVGWVFDNNTENIKVCSDYDIILKNSNDVKQFQPLLDIINEILFKYIDYEDVDYVDYDDVKTNTNIKKKFDLISCNLNIQPYKRMIQILELFTEFKFRYSTNKTGNQEVDCDWILEEGNSDKLGFNLLDYNTYFDKTLVEKLKVNKVDFVLGKDIQTIGSRFTYNQILTLKEKNFTDKQIIDLNSKISYDQIIDLLNRKSIPFPPFTPFTPFTPIQIDNLNCRISYDQIISLLNKGFTPIQIDNLYIQPNGSSFTPRQIDNLKKRFTQKQIDEWDYIKSYDEIIRIKASTRSNNQIIEGNVSSFIEENPSSFTTEQISELEIDFTPAQIDNLEYRISYNQIKFFLINKLIPEQINKFTPEQIDNFINVDFTPTEINDLLDKTFTPEQIDNLINVNFTYEQILRLRPDMLNEPYNVEELFGLNTYQKNTLITKIAFQLSDKTVKRTQSYQKIINQKIINQRSLYITLGLLNAGYPYSKIIDLLNKGLDIKKLNTKQMLSYATYEKFNKANINDEQIAQMLNFGLNQSLNVFTECLTESYNPCIFKNIFDILDINIFDKEEKNNAFTPQQLIYMLINGYSLLNILNWRDLSNLKLSNTISTNTITYYQYNKLKTLGYPNPSQSRAIINLMNNGLSNTIADNTITYFNYLYLTTTLNNSNIICTYDILARLMNAGLTSNASILTDKTLVQTHIINDMMYIIDNYNNYNNIRQKLTYNDIVACINSGETFTNILADKLYLSYNEIIKLLSIQIEYKLNTEQNNLISAISIKQIVNLLNNNITLDNISLSDIIGLSYEYKSLNITIVTETDGVEHINIYKVNNIQYNEFVKINTDIVTLLDGQTLNDIKLLSLFEDQ